MSRVRLAVILAALSVWGSGCVRFLSSSSKQSTDLAPPGTEGWISLGMDGALSDLVVDADARSDAADPDGFCAVRPALMMACGCPPYDDTDCDALPRERDPQPDQCNPLLYETQFEKDPLAEASWSTVNGSWAWTRGCLHQQATTNPPDTLRYSWARAGDPALSDSDYLVEARILLGAVGELDFWEAGIVARLASLGDGDQMPAEFISCMARIDRSIDICYGCVPQRNVLNPDLRIESKSSDLTDWKAAWPLDNPAGIFGGEEGGALLLQLWFQREPAKVRCRIYDAKGAPRREAFFLMSAEGAEYIKYLPPGPGSVGLRTWGRAASFDYVRVFALR